MRAFFTGLLFLAAVAILSAAGMLFLPFLMAMVFFLRVIVGGALAVFFIWLLGTLIIFMWDKIIKKS